MRSLKGALLLFMVVLMSACSGKPVKTYEGARLPEGDVALLLAGDNIEVTKVDGKEMKKYLLSEIDTTYALTPGKHRIVFNYKSVWAVAPRGPEDARSELVESPAQVVEVEVKAGDRLSFEFDEVGDVREARAFAERFTANVVDNQGKIIASSDLYREATEQQLAEQAVAQANVASEGGVSKAAGLPALEAMKVIWEGASLEDKKAFLKWAYQ